MTHDRLYLVPLALGHVALFVLLFNMAHGLGHRAGPLGRVKAGVLVLFLAVSGVVAWESWNGAIESWSWPSLAYGAVCLATGLLFFPAATAYLHHRPRPRGVRGRSETLDLAGAHGFQALTGTGPYAWLLRIPGNESFRLCKAEWDVTIPRLPAGLDGLSILHLSDLHLAPSFDRRFFEAVIDEAAAMPSDLVVFTGDLVDDDEAAGWVVPLLSRLHGRLGNYAILGNHDVEHDPDLLRSRLVEAGFTDLEGRWATVDAGGMRIALGGTSHPWGPDLPWEDAPAADLRMLLSHAPDLFYRAERAGFDLMLSGHNHGGQVRLPFVGPVFMPSRYSRRFDRGFFRKGSLTLHVSQGVAGKHPVRFGCLPEIGRLVLRSADPETGPARDVGRDLNAAEEVLR